MRRVLKYFIVTLSVVIVTTLGVYGYLKLSNNPMLDFLKTSPNSPAPTQESVFSPLVTEKRQITGYVKNSESVPTGIRPTCEGEYYLDDGTEVVWLTAPDSSKDERQEAFAKYEDAQVTIDGDYKKHENECDSDGERFCTCYDYIMVNDIKPIETN